MKNHRDVPLEKIHKELLLLLLSLDGICKENSIKYYITAGTLLGAVREGGFIAWDDDCDVVMPRSDFRRFVKIMRKADSEFYYFQDRKNERKYPFAFVKIRSRQVGARERGKVWEGLGNGCYVDVFPLDRCPKNPQRARRFFKLTELLTSVILSKNGSECGYTKRSVRLIFSLLSLFPLAVLHFLRDAVRIYYRATSSGERLATVYGSYGYPRETYRREWFSRAVTLSFEGRKFPAPTGYRELLTNMYGDYMTPPGKENQRTHLQQEGSP